VQAAATRNVEKDSVVKRKPVKTQKTLHKDTTTKSIAADSSLVKESDKPAVTDPDSANEVDGPDEHETTPITKGRYKILDKAYFHDARDENTRRAAFLIHWNNSYATLQALDEKNGFIYLVFRNHLNQVSKGWLRKKDLKRID
jgi:hypothetical protein